VFGCAGSVTDDVMIAAMERIKTDGMDVLNMSIGDAFNNWAGSPTAAAADALVDAGIVVVASIGNSGANGIYSAGAPGVGDKVIGVASYDNSHVQAPGFTVSPDGTAVPYNDSSSNVPGIPDPPNPPTSGTMTIKQTAAAAAIGPVPPNGFPGGRRSRTDVPRSPPVTSRGPLLIRRALHLQREVANAEAASVAVVLYNHSAGESPLVTSTADDDPGRRDPSWTVSSSTTASSRPADHVVARCGREPTGGRSPGSAVRHGGGAQPEPDMGRLVVSQVDVSARERRLRRSAASMSSPHVASAVVP
jgi:hypothetical protein